MQQYVSAQCTHPFVKWVGGKRRSLNQLFKFVPDQISTYVEPFVGGGAMYFALKFQRAIINDSNAELINAYLQVRDHLPELKQMLRTFPIDKEFFLKIRSWDRDEDFKQRSEIERAARLIYLIKTCYNGLYRVNRKNCFNTPFGRFSHDPLICDEAVLDAASAYLNQHETKIVCKNYLELADQIPDDAFVYLDPPYHPISETSHFTSYQAQEWGEDEQRRLYEFCSILDQRGIKFMMTNSTAQYIINLYSKFNMVMINAGRNINSVPAKRGSLKELLILNYDFI